MKKMFTVLMMVVTLCCCMSGCANIENNMNIISQTEPNAASNVLNNTGNILNNTELESKDVTGELVLSKVS